MRYPIMLAMPLAMLLAYPAMADDNDRDRPGPGDPERMKQLIEEFDDDGDGQLNREERQAARRARAERYGDSDRPARRGGPPEDADRGRRRGGPPEHAGHGHRHHGHHGPRDRFDDGPPRSGPPEDFDRGPRRGDWRDRGPRDDFDRGPQQRGPRDRFDRGPRGDGPPEGAERGRRPMGPPEGVGRGGPPGPPDPEVMFERLDEDGDGVLSKAEFLILAERVRRMGRGGPAGPPPRGPRPEAGGDDRPGPPPGEFRRGGGERRGFGRPRPELDDE